MAESLKQTKETVYQEFDNNALPALLDYVRIPNLSQMFDPEWNTNGLLDKAAEHIKNWIIKQGIKGTKVEILREDQKAPLIFVEIDRTDSGDDTVLFYGHYDKQPHFLPWKEGLSPIDPVIIDGKLYGRGCADDGYSAFSATLCVKVNQMLGKKHPRICMMIEGAEESSSANFLYYLEKLQSRVGKPKLVVCLDSGAGDYETMWLTDSLRGNIKGELKVKVLNEGVHSGDASGIVPDSFRILRDLLDRVENPKTGEINEIFQVDIPPNRYAQVYDVVKILDKTIVDQYPFINKDMKPVTENLLQSYLNRTWRAQLAIVGVDGLPSCANAGNVLRPETSIRFSLRLPPTCKGPEVAPKLKELLEKDAPYGCEVTCDILSAMSGFNSPDLDKEIQTSLQSACQSYFGKPYLCQGEGGSIPLMNLFNEKWPGVQFIVTGVLGPNSNAHGPNEMLHLDFCKKLTCCLTQMLGDMAV
ncbi:hypothetical protein PPERSA_02972 [Pseudocohnilembus persalinus]|uniref:Uncharacterized protein n=1 Tax=Pseudocohnilembus persalinus TaxID=266149 RepID=A0A0V0Q7E4_PSEPJ|nr:hypothetical protein PPERSA_02972 [Pseudocohnilembus persalinus]|eukprot:KRW98085.1 hypothetical protein PPERSA_02972 [Pseudocohnilembus persalinus]